MCEKIEYLSEQLHSLENRLASLEKIILQIGIKSRGYNMKKEEKNLLVCIGFLGLAVSESNTHYRLTNDQIVKLLGAKGITTS